MRLLLESMRMENSKVILMIGSLYLRLGLSRNTLYRVKKYQVDQFVKMLLGKSMHVNFPKNHRIKRSLGFTQVDIIVLKDSNKKN